MKKIISVILLVLLAGFIAFQEMTYTEVRLANVGKSALTEVDISIEYGHKSEIVWQGTVQAGDTIATKFPVHGDGSIQVRGVYQGKNVTSDKMGYVTSNMGQTISIEMDEIGNFHYRSYSPDIDRKGWEPLALADFNGDYDPLRLEKKSYYLSDNGHYNDHQYPDYVEIAKKDDRIALIVYLSQVKGGFSQHILKTGTFKEFKGMGVTKYKSGTYKTWCGKQPDDCDKDEPREIILKYDAVYFFQFESSGSLYFYDKEAFKNVWMSD